MPGPASQLAGIGISAGKEVVKPVSSVAEALAGPWIARLRRWAQDRELQQRLDDPSLPDAFSDYARRLAERVGGANTVISRNALPLSVIYEPLSLLPRGSDAPISDAELRREGARTFVVDEAGMGKSTFARHLIAQALEVQDLIPVLLEFRRVDASTGLVEALAREFDNIDKRFDREMLLRLFVVGRFLFVLDGLDEAAADIRGRLVSEIEELAGGTEYSAIVVTTRPEVALPALSTARVLSISPLTQQKAESLVRRYDRALGDLDVGERLILDFHAVPSRFLQTPLLVALLYRTFGYTQSVSTRISVFYDELYNALYKGHDLTKSGFVRSKESGLDVAEFRRMLRGFSFLLIANDKTSLEGETDAQQLADAAAVLTAVKPESPAKFVTDLLAAVPLLIRDGRELRFIHKSIAEFFAAEYLVIGTPDGESIAGQITGGPLAPQFTGALDFIADLDPPFFIRTIVRPMAEVAVNFEPDEVDPVLRSLRFLADIEVMLVDDDEAIIVANSLLSEEGKDRFMIESLGWHSSIAFLYKLRHPRMTPVTWGQLSEPEVERVIGEPNEEDVESLKGLLPETILLDLTDSRVSRATAHWVFRQTLIRFLDWLQPAYGRSEMRVRVLNQDRLLEILETSRVDREVRSWLRTLLESRTER